MPTREASTNTKLLNEYMVEELLRLIEVKGKSWVKRSLTRINDVYACGEGKWAVRGRKRMGDAEPLYIVTYDERARRFRCTCSQAHKPYANNRRGSCSHIGACLLHHILH